MGGEIDRHTGFIDLLGIWGYEIEPTSHEKKNKNYLDERPHLTIAT